MQHLTSFDTNTLKTALESLIPTGIFDTVTYAYGEITCKKDEKTIIVFSQSGDTWKVVPYLNQSTQATGSHVSDYRSLANGYLCAQGLYLMTVSSSGSVQHIILTKGNTGNAVTMIGNEATSISLASSCAYFITSYGDDTSLALYTYGYSVPGMATSTTAADRTQLLKLPIVGQQGSTDYVTGCQGILLRQFSDPGNVEIDGVKYFCINRFAIVDE